MMVVIATLLLLLAGLLIYAYWAGPTLPPETDAIIEAVANSELLEVVVGQTGFATSSGLSIWYESILPTGPPKGAVLLLVGAGGNALMWPPKFVRAFVEAGYQLIRYDHRGTGMSDWVEGWDRRSPYTVADMAADAVAVLNALDIEAAHLVGLSMGGMIAQEVAIQHPRRVASLTLMMTSGFIGDPELPGLSSRYLLASMVKGIPLLKYRLMGGEKNLVKERLAKQIAMLGNDHLDIKEISEIVLYDVRNRRGIHMRGVMQHQTAVAVSGSRYEKLSALQIPALVIHGTADPLIPLAHGQKLAAIMPQAKGWWLEGVGHIVPDMERLAGRILAHLDDNNGRHITYL